MNRLHHWFWFWFRSLSDSRFRIWRDKTKCDWSLLVIYGRLPNILEKYTRVGILFIISTKYSRKKNFCVRVYCIVYVPDSLMIFFHSFFRLSPYFLIIFCTMVGLFICVTREMLRRRKSIRMTMSHWIWCTFNAYSEMYDCERLWCRSWKWFPGGHLNGELVKRRQQRNRRQQNEQAMNWC